MTGCRLGAGSDHASVLMLLNTVPAGVRSSPVYTLRDFGVRGKLDPPIAEIRAALRYAFCSRLTAHLRWLTA